jgi:hypothetical protein
LAFVHDFQTKYFSTWLLNIIHIAIFQMAARAQARAAHRAPTSRHQRWTKYQTLTGREGEEVTGDQEL